MKIIILLLFLNFSLCSPAPAAESADGKETVKTEAADKKEAAQESKKDDKEEKAPGEYSCPFYTIRLPAGWKAIRPPEEKQGLVNAIFAKNPASPIVTIIVGPRQGAAPDLIAAMFAEQFKATKDPAQKNGQFFFSYPQPLPDSQSPVTANACLSSDGEYFMLTTYTGNQKEAQNFIKNSLSSDDYPNLVPKY